MSNQNLNASYVVLYNASAKDANSTVVERRKLDLPFIVDTKAYAYYTDSPNEAYYLCAILNSSTPNKLMKDFQARGLFGARHVHKKILDIYYPRYDSNNDVHTKLAEASKEAHVKVSAFLNGLDEADEFTGMKLGKLRLEAKGVVADELKTIDKLVRKVLRS